MVPLHADRGEPAPPPQQHEGIGPHAAPTVAASGEVAEELRDRTNHLADVVVDQPGNTGATGANAAPPLNLQLFKITRQSQDPRDATVIGYLHLSAARRW